MKKRDYIYIVVGGKTYKGKQLSGKIYESKQLKNSKQVQFRSTLIEAFGICVDTTVYLLHYSLVDFVVNLFVGSLGGGRLEGCVEWAQVEWSRWGRYLSCKNCEERFTNLLVGCMTIDPLEQGINDLASKLPDSIRVRS